MTDPADPRYDPDKFRYFDYEPLWPGREGKHGDALRKLFPPGTPKEFVDRVLVEAGGAHAVANNNFEHPVWTYYHPKVWYRPKGSPSDAFYFDDCLRVTQIHAFGEKFLFPEPTTIKETPHDNP